MTTYFVSRHEGAREWARRRGLQCEFVEALTDTSVLRQGDVVAGNLPTHLAAEVCRRGAFYQHLGMDVPRDARGTDQTADEMEAFGARLIPFDVRELAASPSPALDVRGIRARVVNAWRRLDRTLAKATALFAAAIAGAVAPAAISPSVAHLLKAPLALVCAAFGAFFAVVAIVLVSAIERETPPSFVDRALRLPVVRRLAGLSVFAKARPGWSPRVVLAASLAAMLAIASTGAGQALSGDRTALGEGAWSFLIWSLVFVLAVAVLASIGRGLFRMEIVQHSVASVPPRPVVLMFLSVLTNAPRKAAVLARDSEGRIVVQDGGPESLAEDLRLIFDEDRARKLDDVCASGTFATYNFPWQQNFRVLASQFGDGRRLQCGRVVVLTSKASHDQFPWFRESVETLAARSGVKLTITEAGDVDFANLLDVEATIHEVVNDLVDEKPRGQVPRWRYDEILIDATGGLKLTSIAGAASTFASEMMFSYVENSAVQLFDARSTFGK